MRQPYLWALCALLCSQLGYAHLKPSGRITISEVNECSGVVRSAHDANVYWVINDSGDGPFLYPMDRHGSAAGSKVRVKGATNIDWEALTLDDQGRLIIGDVGNNANTRRDLTLYWVDEPRSESERTAEVLRKVLVHYPDQEQFPPEKPDYDCEAIFWADGKVHLLTKRRSDLRTELYRLESIKEDVSNPLVKVSTFNTLGPVTAADCTEDGSKLAVLTYTGVWLFERHGAQDWFSGSISFLPLIAGQAEAICWVDEKTLLIANEQRDIYEVDIGSFSLLRR